ncbi:hypothetical protein ACPPVU_02490 [Mucilaginibacter sp. McL0603]|uniref:hypothetical protein n=1 Tax=Mucilaginibacter sp. McL0603 TaxID=3415670 RepID=UPI003CF0A6D0
MNTFVIEEFFVEEKNACNFYTVRLIDRDNSETDRFYDQFEQHNEYSEDFGMIHALIVELADRGMQVIHRVRQESKAFAFPPKSLARDVQFDVFENNLRLYYVPVSEDIVILLGGGIAHDSLTGKPSMALWDAQNFAKKINSDGQEAFVIKGNKLFPAGDEDLITIY